MRNIFIYDNVVIVNARAEKVLALIAPLEQLIDFVQAFGCLGLKYVNHYGGQAFGILCIDQNERFETQKVLAELQVWSLLAGLNNEGGSVRWGDDPVMSYSAASSKICLPDEGIRWVKHQAV